LIATNKVLYEHHFCQYENLILKNRLPNLDGVQQVE
jgi:hypothetical protein